jgi:hypothetical protein
MSSAPVIPLIYKYPIIQELVDSNDEINPIYLNPHANLIEYSRHNEVDKYWLSRHPSNKAMDMLIKNKDLINIYGLIYNPNPRVGYILEKSMHLFKGLKWRDTWLRLSYSTNPGVLEFLEKHPNKIDWMVLSDNEHPIAIRILKNHPDKIVWWILSKNPSAMDLLLSNLEKIDWENFCRNTNPQAIKIIEQNMDKINLDMLSYNSNAIHIILQNLDKMMHRSNNLSENTNPKAIEILRDNPSLIDLSLLFKNPSAIPYLETQIETILGDTDMRFHYLGDLAENPNGIPLLQKLFDTGVISKNDLKDLSEDFLVGNESVYDLDYQAMSKIRSRIIISELEEKVFHPDRVRKWLDYYCDNGGEVIEFDWI